MAVIREAVFSILGARVEGAKVADVCAGTGTFGLEALSRGAVFVVFLEKSKKMADLITKNLESLGLTGFAEVWPMDAQKGIQCLGRLRGVDIVFLDPPFFSEAGPRIMEALLEAPGLWRLLIVRFHKKEDWPKKLVDAFQDQVWLAKDKSYGESSLLFLEQREGSDVCAGHE
jgi:16S rRNA (guanine966-N2)-methyltransferase